MPADALGGRGLALVDVLARSRGVTVHPAAAAAAAAAAAGAGDAGSAPSGGKTVWLTLAAGA